MIVLSTITAVYLWKAESSGISEALSDEREGELNDALACARADIDSSLNIACIIAQSEVGESPVINVSESCPYPGDAAAVNMARIKDLTHSRLSGYMDKNYAGNFAYGDYRVNAMLDGDYKALAIEPVAMNITRTWYSPMPCQDEYEAYYIVSVPVRITVSRPGTPFNYSERYISRTLVTARYPLLENLTGEYERRLNGTPLFVDLTAASFAYTWARGYCQYGLGEPMNIVDDKDLALMANAGVLLEQGFEYNSVDPMALAALARNTYQPDKTLGEVVNEDDFNDLNNYNFTNSSQSTLPKKTNEPLEYRFNVSDIVDKELRATIADPYARYYMDMAYSCRMHMNISRRSIGERYNWTGSTCIDSYKLQGAENGTGPFFREVWKAWVDNSDGKGWVELVTIDFTVEHYSAFNGEDNVQAPYEETEFRDAGGDKYVDSNLKGAVDCYAKAVDLSGVIFDHDKYPGGFSGLTRQFTSTHNEWVGKATAVDLRELADSIDKDVSVTLKARDYGAYDEMMDTAYGRMRQQFFLNYSRYLDEERYIYSSDGPVYRSCGAKYAYYQRAAFLKRVGDDLNQSLNAAAEVNKKIDDEMKKYSDSMNSSTMKDNARSSKNFLQNELYIPFGMRMNLSSQPETSGNYTWKEDVKFGIDQRPNYLTTEVYADPETGYLTRPLRVRNVCVFALPTDFVDTEQATGAVLDGIDAISSAAYQMANDSVAAESERLIEDMARTAKEKMREEIHNTLVNDTEVRGDVTEDELDDALDRAFSERSPRQAVEGLKNGTVQTEVARELAEKAKRHAGQEMEKNVDQYVDAYGDYVAGKVEETVLGAEQRAISSAINALNGRIKQVVKDFTAEAMDHAENEAVKAALKRIPSGLPLLPPWGWWATMNVWYIEIQGEIPCLTVYDVDNVPVPDTVLGHRAIAYTRRDIAIFGPDGLELGRNEPIKFSQKTCTFIIVPPGERGIGDKIGGWDEKSSGFDSRSEEKS